MKIAVFGLGYVGTVSAACLANAGHHVVGVDLNRTKVELVNRGESPVLEKRLGLLLKEAVAQDRLHATTEAEVAVARSDMAWICVGTPSLSRGGLDLSQLERVGAAIGRALISNPRVLLCDELSLGLAPIVIRDIYAALPRIKASGTSVIVVEQDIVQALRVADRVYCFQEGRLSLTGRPRELSSSTRTVAPSRSRRLTRAEPMKPEPPVTRIRLALMFQPSRIR